jgi:hypothetical protein
MADALLSFDAIISHVFSLLDTPRDAICFGLVCKRHAEVFSLVKFRAMKCDVGDLAALDWIVKHVDRVAKFDIRYVPESTEAVVEEHGDPSSELYRDLKRHLYGCTRPLLPVLAMRTHVLDTSSRTISYGMCRATCKHGYDVDTDAYAGAAFAWSIDGDIITGSSGQLQVSVHVWLDQDGSGNVTAEVHRCSNRDLLWRGAGFHGNLVRTCPGMAPLPWTEIARTLYNGLAPFEERPREPEDGDEDD